MSKSVFKRNEYKYIITEEQYDSIIETIESRLRADVYGETTIQSLYFDTDDYRLIRTSIEKPDYKEKLRLRSYGLAKEDGEVFLELKKKCSGVVFKRRIQTTEKEIAVCELNNSQIAKEIEYFISFYGKISPKMLILYDRTAYFGEGELRVTFDRNARYRTDRLSLSAGLDGVPLFDDEKIIMEIKSVMAIPLWLVKLLSKNKIYKTSYSKYGEAYKKELNKKKEIEL